MDHPGDFEVLARRIKETKGLRTREAAENLLDQAVVAMVVTSEQGCRCFVSEAVEQALDVFAEDLERWIRFVMTKLDVAVIWVRSPERGALYQVLATVDVIDRLRLDRYGELWCGHGSYSYLMPALSEDPTLPPAV